MSTRKEEKFFIRLCEQYHKKILKYLYYTVGNIEDAKDLTQEVFTLVYDRIEEVSTHENPAGFIYQTAKFLAANFKRRQTAKSQYDYNSISKGLKETEQSAYDSMLQEQNDIIDVTYYIDKVLDIMDEEQRKLYGYRYIEKKTYKEIGRLLKVDEVTLRMRCLRLRKHLIKKIHEMGEEYFE